MHKKLIVFCPSCKERIQAHEVNGELRIKPCSCGYLRGEWKEHNETEHARRVE